MTKRDGVAIFRRAFPQAQSLWTVKVPDVGTIEAFVLGTTIVLIQDYVGGNGWQAYTPTTDEGKIDLTLQAIADRTGVTIAGEDVYVCPQCGSPVTAGDRTLGNCGRCKAV